MCSSDVGSAFYQIGKYDLATVLFEQALRILLQVTEDEQSLEVADLLYKIASCHESRCEYDEGKVWCWVFLYNLIRCCLPNSLYRIFLSTRNI